MEDMPGIGEYGNYEHGGDGDDPEGGGGIGSHEGWNALSADGPFAQAWEAHRSLVEGRVQVVCSDRNEREAFVWRGVKLERSRTGKPIEPPIVIDGLRQRLSEERPKPIRVLGRQVDRQIHAIIDGIDDRIVRSSAQAGARETAPGLGWEEHCSLGNIVSGKVRAHLGKHPDRAATPLDLREFSFRSGRNEAISHLRRPSTSREVPSTSVGEQSADTDFGIGSAALGERSEIHDLDDGVHPDDESQAGDNAAADANPGVISHDELVRQVREALMNQGRDGRQAAARATISVYLVVTELTDGTVGPGEILGDVLEAVLDEIDRLLSLDGRDSNVTRRRRPDRPRVLETILEMLDAPGQFGGTSPTAARARHQLAEAAELAFRIAVASLDKAGEAEKLRRFHARQRAAVVAAAQEQLSFGASTLQQREEALRAAAEAAVAVAESGGRAHPDRSWSVEQLGVWFAVHKGKMMSALAQTLGAPVTEEDAS